MTISLVVAVAENGVIGRDGKLPWHLPKDLDRFKKLTSGHTIVMGRRTFQAIGRALPNRRSLVLTRNPDWTAAGAEVFHDLSAALATVGRMEEVFVIGGAKVFELAIPLADRIYMTVVHAHVDGDTEFPKFDLSDWQQLAVEHHDSDGNHLHSFSFSVYIRREKPHTNRPVPIEDDTGLGK